MDNTEKYHVDIEKVLEIIKSNQKPHPGQAFLALSLAASAGYNTVIQILVENGVDVNFFVDEPPLSRAAAEGHLETVKYLISIGAEIDLQDHYGNTALMSAVSKQHLDVVRFLVAAGADVNLESEGTCALETAAFNGNLEMFNYLAPLTDSSLRRFAIQALPKGIKNRVINKYKKVKGQNLLSLAVQQIEEAYSITVQEAINRKEQLNEIQENGCTILWTLTHSSCIKPLRTLIQEGADVNRKNMKDGWSPLMISIGANLPLRIGTIEAWGEEWSCQQDTAKILIEAGADVNQVNNDHKTPLMIAADLGDLEMTDLLLKSGADVQRIDVYGKSALDYAEIDEDWDPDPSYRCFYRYEEIYQRLVCP